MEIQDLKTFEDACKVEGIEKLNLDLSSFPEALRAPVEAATKLMIINKAANRIDNNGEEWKPDWNDDEWKNYPWFEMGGSSGFRSHDYDRWISHSHVGSRLCFKKRSTAIYIAKQFESIPSSEFERYLAICAQRGTFATYLTNFIDQMTPDQREIIAIQFDQNLFGTDKAMAERFRNANNTSHENN